MAEIVHPPMRQIGSFQKAGEVAVEIAWLDGAAEGVRENKAAVRPRIASDFSFGFLACFVPLKCPQGEQRQRCNCAHRAFGFRRAKYEAGARTVQGVANAQHSGPQIDIRPLQAECFALSLARNWSRWSSLR
jgi:hypothetical protein